ncbi:MAG: HAD family hydrolase [Terriglobia bacterium]
MHSSSLPAAAIFDMDGVLVDSNPFHIEKWIELLNDRKVPFSRDELPRQILGQRNDHAFRLFFGSRLAQPEMKQLGAELEAKFRNVFRPHARPLPGLVPLLCQLRSAGIPLAVASSAIRENVEFVVETIGLRPFFQCLINGDEVLHPKPDPEIYLKTAGKLGVEADECVGFEDSFAGIEAVKRAGMKCVAIASTFPPAELKSTRADFVATGFKELSLGRLRRLFDRLAEGTDAK